MSRYIGPLWKKSRALGFSLLGNKKEFSLGKKRTVPPGQHAYKRKRRPSLYAFQNKEKSKIIFYYNISEKQLNSIMVKQNAVENSKTLLNNKESVIKEKEAATYKLIPKLESRLDSLVLRSGLSPTRRFARQIIVHGHVSVDGKKVNIPSFFVKAGSTITLHEKMHNNKIIESWLKQNVKPVKYLEVDKDKFKIKYLRYPSNEELKELTEGINISLVTEWYNRKI